MSVFRCTVRIHSNNFVASAVEACIGSSFALQPVGKLGAFISPLSHSSLFTLVLVLILFLFFPLIADGPNVAILPADTKIVLYFIIIVFVLYRMSTVGRKCQRTPKLGGCSVLYSLLNDTMLIHAIIHYMLLGPWS